MTKIHPFFLNADGGRLFATYYQSTHAAQSRAVLCFPPFAEELNKCRRMMSLKARELAAGGDNVLVIDLFGTGDSEGQFEQAQWSRWLDNMAVGLQWLRDKGYTEISYWGIRLGALLAADFCRHSSYDPTRLVFWQPVVSGELAMTQFLRLRMAADFVSGSEKITPNMLRTMLREGKSVEVAGYGLNADLVGAVDSLKLAELLSKSNCKVVWYEVVAERDRPVPMASRNVIESMKANGCGVNLIEVVGESFWATPEISVVPELVKSDFFL